MAGNIPPLVSCTPPPLCAFDDDEEEEEDEFGIYNTPEEIDYNECISFKEKDEGKQNVGKPRREQDSTSQDSATDSGLCPDSEGMSPTPHSDDERTIKQNSCDKQCQKNALSVQKTLNCDSEHGETFGSSSANVESNQCPTLPNGHVGLEDHYILEESDDDFGNFEFAPSHSSQFTNKDELGEDILSHSSPTLDVQYTEKESGKVVLNSLPLSHDEQYSDEEEETGKGVINSLSASHSVCCIKKADENEGYFTHNLSESSLSPSKIEGSNFTPEIEKNCEGEQSSTVLDEFVDQKLDSSISNENLSFNSIDSNLEPTNINSTECMDLEQRQLNHGEELTKEGNENVKPDVENVVYNEISSNQFLSENDDEFDDFTDFKADFSNCFDPTKSEEDNECNELSKAPLEQTKLEEASSLPLSHPEESDDEFSNFADFSSSDCAFVSAQSSNSLENVPHIPLKLDDSDLRTESEFQDWVSVFPCDESESPLPNGPALLRENDIVWSRLVPLESSPALSYQWNESLANRRLLTALNIDSRNILFMPWSNTAVPRFAANLGCGPLEPIKATEPLQPSLPPQPAPPPANTQESVPDAHFDWVSSGLTNPLDSSHSSLLDLNFMMTLEPHLAISPKTVLNLPKTLSAEAENILSLLPDISFMRKTYIDFPISEA